MSEVKVSRFVCLVMALFPALWGLFSFLNNLAGFSGTVQYAVAPLLSMENTANNSWLMWRAIDLPWAGYVGLALITTMETLGGIFASLGLIVMVKNFNKSYLLFSKGKALAMLGASCAVLVWGVGFMVVAGDWFMAWQAKVNPLNTQLGAMIYALPCITAIIVLLAQKENHQQR
ncbi:DUF2165 family protein [Orbus wheelerorum]|uniref:DUF2165 family protein n=1 Tax=Orbus wheelerorum TaxID=3074111 RepID=UPI00370D81CB